MAEPPVDIAVPNPTGAIPIPTVVQVGWDGTGFAYMPTNPAFSATIAPFEPTGIAALAATTSSSNVALGSSDTTVVIWNLGPNAAYGALGSSGVTATTGSPIYVPSGGSTTAVNAGGTSTNIAFITATGTAALTIQTGTGQPANAVGSSGGSSGGTVDIGANALDQTGTLVLNAASLHEISNITLGNGYDSCAVYITGLTASGATLTVLQSIDGVTQAANGVKQSGLNYNTISVDGIYLVANVPARKSVGFEVNTTGTGTVDIAFVASTASPLDASANASIFNLGQALIIPAGTVTPATALAVGYDGTNVHVLNTDTLGHANVNVLSGATITIVPSGTTDVLVEGGTLTVSSVAGTVDVLVEGGTLDAVMQVGTANVSASNAVPTKAGSTSPLGYQQLTSLASAGTLTVPGGATFAIVQANLAPIRWRDDGTAPTGTVGMQIPNGGTLVYTGALGSIQFIQESANGTLDVSYYK